MLDFLLLIIFFIRYAEKRWIPRGRKEKSSPSVNDKKESPHRLEAISGAYKNTNNVNPVSTEKKIIHQPVANNGIPTPKSCSQMNVNVPLKVIMVFICSYTLNVALLPVEWRKFVCSK